MPTLVEQLLVRWMLEVDGPRLRYVALVALVVPVRRPGGQPAMLEVSWIDDETRVEAVALSRWRDAPAVDLLASAPEVGALLLERLDPSRSLLDVHEDEAVAVAVTLLRQLHAPPVNGLTAATDVARRLQSQLREEWTALGRPGRADLLELGVSTCRDLATSPGPVRLLHGDFHSANVLARARSSGAGAAQVRPRPPPAEPLVGARRRR